MIKNTIYTAESVRGNLFNIRNGGLKRGAYTGLPSLYEKYSMKLGYTTYIYASPHQGKSQFGFQLLVDSARFNGWRWAIFSPESGSPADVFSELLWVYLRKPFVENEVLMATDEEVQAGIKFINSHFFIIDSGLQDITATELMAAAQEIEYEHGKIQGLFVDPYTEVVNDTANGIRDDIAIGRDLSRFRKISSDRNWHTIVTVHTKYLQSRYKDGISFVPKPTFGDIAGGQMWSRRGFMIINIWRCPVGLVSEDGIPYEQNEVEITIQKAKPKICGKLGVVRLFYDKLTNQYYEKDDMGEKIISCQNPDIDYDAEDIFIDREGNRLPPEIVERPKEVAENELGI